MRLVFRALVTLVVSVSVLYFVYWIGGAVLSGRMNVPMERAFVLSLLLGLAAAPLAGYLTWTGTGSWRFGLLSAMLRGAVITGGVGFAAGFFGPMLLTPDANQGPLLGIFITGPLGFVAGGIGGAAYWLARGRRETGG